MVSVPFSTFYKGKRVLITGHTGFKGGWLSLWLDALGAKLSGYSLPPIRDEDFFNLLPEKTFVNSWLQDIRDPDALKTAILESEPEIIFHLAAQPLVGLSYRKPLDTLTTNVLGTAYLLETLREIKSPSAVVIVTSDKCYRNDNRGRPFAEDDPLGGSDVYSMSKAAAELVAAAWYASFFKDNGLGPLATGRAGNVIGGGDYAEDRILPDAVRAFQAGQPLVLRRPQATRPWQHVLESLSGYLTLGQHLFLQSDRKQLPSFNFGPYFEAERTVQELVDNWVDVWPGCFEVQVTGNQFYSEATYLSLDNTKVVQQLGWKPVWNFRQTVEQTAMWYRKRHEKQADNIAMLAFSKEQIATYTRDAGNSDLLWAS